MKHKSRNADLLANSSEKEAKKARATLETKGRIFNTIINISIKTTFITGIISGAGILISNFTNILSYDSTTLIIIIAMAITILSMIALLFTLIIKRIWVHKLHKLGINIPIELD